MTKGQRTIVALLAAVAVLLAADAPADDLLINTEALYVRSASGKVGVSVIGSSQGGKLTVFDSIGQPTFSITGNKIESSALERFVRKFVVEELAKSATVTTPPPTPRSTGGKALRYTQDDLLVGGTYFEVTVGNVRRVMGGHRGRPQAGTVVWELLLLVRNTGPFDCLNATLTTTAFSAKPAGSGIFSAGFSMPLIVTRLKQNEIQRYVINFIGPDREPSEWLEFSLSRQNFERWE